MEVTTWTLRYPNREWEIIVRFDHGGAGPPEGANLTIKQASQLADELKIKIAQAEANTELVKV